MNSDLKTFVTNPLQDIGAAPADIGTGQQRAVQKCGKTIVGDNGRARHLFQEARSENALDGTPGVVGPEAKKESGVRIVPFEQFKQARYTFACSAQGIDIDL